MIPTFRVPYQDGDLRIGWASWDGGSYRSRSIKYAYPDASGKISRGCPELPFDILVDMVDLAARQGELSPEQLDRLHHLRPRGDMADLLTRFNPAIHRRDLELDVEPVGTESR